MDSKIKIEFEQPKYEKKPDEFTNIYYIYELELSENPSFSVNYLVFEFDEDYNYIFQINGHITSIGSNGNINCRPEILRDIKNLYNGIYDKNEFDRKYATSHFERKEGENIIYGKLYIKKEDNKKEDKYLNPIEFSYNNNNNYEVEMGDIKNFDNILERAEADRLAKEEAAKEADRLAKEEAAKEEAAAKEADRLEQEQAAAKEAAAKEAAEKSWPFWCGKRKKQIKTKKLKK
jgi:hypothetical protein